MAKRKKTEKTPEKVLRTTESMQMAASELLKRCKNVVTDDAAPVTMCAFGTTKVGKTHIIGTAPGPILVFETGWERGSSPTLRATGRDDIHILRLIGHSLPHGRKLKDNEVVMEEVLEQIADLVADLNIRTVAFDTYTMYLQMYKSELTQFGEISSNYDTFTMLYQGTLNLLQIVANLDVHLIITAHEKHDEDLGKVTPDLIGKSGEAILKASNIIARCFRKEKNVYDDDGKATGEIEQKYGMALKSPPDSLAALEVGTHFDAQFKRAFYPNTFKVFEKYLVKLHADGETVRDTPLIMW